MKDKIFLCSLVVILFCQSTTKAQFWFVQGKTWSYDVTTGFDIHNYGIHRQVVTGDTVIMGKSSKILTYYPKTSPSFVSYVYEENRRVYFFRNFQPELIYDFNLVAGDSLKHKFYSGIVRETGDLIYQDTILKYMIVQYGNAQTPYLQTFLEGIGMAGDPLQNGSYKCGPLIHTWGCHGALDGWDFIFKCLSYYDFTYPDTADCNTSVVNEGVHQQVISIQPNPAYDNIIVSLGGKQM